MRSSTRGQEREQAKRHQTNRQRLACPHCSFSRLIDTGPSTHSITLAVGETGYFEADYYQKCFCCKEEIGIKKIE